MMMKRMIALTWLTVIPATLAVAQEEGSYAPDRL